ncbi:helix-turn-helix domain-containing protein [Thermodesulfitimonas sp.]
MGIGEALRAAREAKGITIATAGEETKIRAKFLEALESEAFSVLPGRVYAKAFLRTYARYLGLDDAALAQEFDLLYPVEEENGTQAAKRVRGEKLISPFNWGRYRNFFLVAGVVGLLLLFNSLYSVIVSIPGERMVNNEEKTRQAISKSQAEEKAVRAAPRSGKEEPAARQAATPSAVSDAQGAGKQFTNGGAQRKTAEPVASQSLVPQGVEVKLSVTQDRCWMRVITDGTVAFEGEVRAGGERVFAAKKQISLRLGNAGVVAVSYNGQELGYLGAVGEVVTREFSAQQG